MSGQVPDAVTPFVPVPTTMLDEWLPRLRDTELRVLLVVCRQTRGRRELQPNGRYVPRKRDWLSHSQLVRRTGRGSEAVSAAIAHLVDQGMLVVETVDGRALTTPQERRRHLSRLYFYLGAVGNVGKTRGITHPAKPKTTRHR